MHASIVAAATLPVSPTPPAPQATAAPDVAPWLRALGFRADEVRRGVARCEAIPHASLEQRVRYALSGLAPRGAHREALAASDSA